MEDARHKNADWNIILRNGDNIAWGGPQLAVLMDIRDELQSINALLRCPNFTEIPHTLKMIRTNTTKPKRRKKP